LTPHGKCRGRIRETLSSAHLAFRLIWYVVVVLEVKQRGILRASTFEPPLVNGTWTMLWMFAAAFTVACLWPRHSQEALDFYKRCRW